QAGRSCASGLSAVARSGASISDISVAIFCPFVLNIPRIEFGLEIRTIHASLSGMFDRNTETQNKPDAISEVLLGMRLRGASYWRLSLSSPFGINFRGGDRAPFHFIGQGQAPLLPPGAGARPMRGGNAVVDPRASANPIVSGPRAAAR